MSTTGERLYRGMSAADRRADRRRRLLDAALDVIGTRGYAAATIPEVCARAGVTARHLYEEFGGREELLLALYGQVVAEHLTVMVEALRSEADDLEATVRQTVDATIRGWVEDERRARLAFIEVVGVSDAVEEQRMATLDAYAKALAADAGRLADAGLIPERDRTIEARAVVGMVTHLIADWLHREDREPIELIIDEVVRLQLAIIAAGEGRTSGTRASGRRSSRPSSSRRS